MLTYYTDLVHTVQGSRRQGYCTTASTLWPLCRACAHRVCSSTHSTPSAVIESSK